MRAEVRSRQFSHVDDLTKTGGLSRGLVLVNLDG